MRILSATLLSVLAVGCATVAAQDPHSPSGQQLAPSFVPNREYPVLVASLTALLPELQEFGPECLVLPETATSLTGTPPRVQEVDFLRDRFAGACRDISCPSLSDDLFEAFVGLNQQRFRIASDLPFPQGYRLIPWSLTWSNPFSAADCYRQRDQVQVLAFSRVAVSSDDSVALHYLQVQRCGYAWGEYVLLVKELHQWRVLTREPLWTAG